MDASVNMKMTPAEHRAIRDALQQAAEVERSIVNDRSASGPGPAEKRGAREREAMYRLLLEKL